jgi:cyanophycin synthetase
MAVHLRQPTFPNDQLAEDAIRAAGFDLASIPPAGTFVPLRRIESTEWGGTPEVMTEVIHEENRRIALKAASLMRLNVAGIDLISTDVRRPWYENGAAINEVNFAPRLGMRFEYQISAIDAMLTDAFPASGRLPVEFFVGSGKALDAALARQRVLAGEGKRCFLSTHATVLDPSGKPVAIALNNASLFMRAKTLLLDPCVDALLLVVQTDELLHTGLPVDSIDRLHVFDNQLAAWGASHSPLPASAVEMLIRHLRVYCIGDGQT